MYIQFREAEAFQKKRCCARLIYILRPHLLLQRRVRCCFCVWENVSTWFSPIRLFGQMFFNHKKKKNNKASVAMGKIRAEFRERRYFTHSSRDPNTPSRQKKVTLVFIMKAFFFVIRRGGGPKVCTLPQKECVAVPRLYDIHITSGTFFFLA